MRALALLVTAPWMTELDAAAFAERLAPARVLLVHDGYVKGLLPDAPVRGLPGYLEKKQIGFEGTWMWRARSSCSPIAPLPQPGPLRG